MNSNLKNFELFENCKEDAKKPCTARPEMRAVPVNLQNLYEFTEETIKEMEQCQLQVVDHGGTQRNNQRIGA